MKNNENKPYIHHSIIALSVALIGLITMIVFFFLNYYLHLVVPMFIGILGIIVATFVMTNEDIRPTEKKITVGAFLIATIVTILSLIYFFNTIRIFTIYTKNINIASIVRLYIETVIFVS